MLNLGRCGEKNVSFWKVLFLLFRVNLCIFDRSLAVPTYNRGLCSPLSIYDNICRHIVVVILLYFDVDIMFAIDCSYSCCDYIAVYCWS